MNHFFTSDLHFGHGNIMKYCGRTLWMTPEEKTLYAEWKDHQDSDKWKERDEQFTFNLSHQSIERMNDSLIDTINSMVEPDDVLWHLGDWCFGPRENNKFLVQAQVYRNRIKCKNVYQIWGNHDRRLLCQDIFQLNDKQLMVAIADNGRYWLEDDHGFDKALKTKEAQGVVLNHYAMLVWDNSHRGTYQLYGHSHSGIEKIADEDLPGRRQFDIGIDNAFKLLGDYRPFSWHEVKEIMKNRPGWRNSTRVKNNER